MSFGSSSVGSVSWETLLRVFKLFFSDVFFKTRGERKESFMEFWAYLRNFLAQAKEYKNFVVSGCETLLQFANHKQHGGRQE
jgi:hypothetical protein